MTDICYPLASINFLADRYRPFFAELCTSGGRVGFGGV